MEKVIAKYICKICNKDYSGYQSLWIHNKKYHLNNDKQTINNCNKHYITNKHIEQNKIVDKKLICKHCDKVFSFSQSRWRHEKTCKNNNIINKDRIIKTLETTIEKQKQLIDIEKENIYPINNQLINLIVEKESD